MHSNIAQEIVNTFNKNSSKVFLKNYKGDVAIDGADAIKYFDKVSNALIAEGCSPYNNIAIYAQNCPEWTLVDVGCMQAQVVTVPLYATNGAKDIQYVIEDAGVNIVFVGERQQYNELLKVDNSDDFRIVVFDEDVTLTTDKSIYFSEWLEQADENEYAAELEQRKKKISIDDLVTIIYTSGTTGKPKGVKLTHLQFVSSTIRHNKVYDFKPEYTSLSFLPLSHIFERAWTVIVLTNGMTNVYLRNPKIIAEALKKVKPNTMCAVPRLYEKIYAGVHEQMAKQSTLKKKIFNWAIAQGKKKVLIEQSGTSVKGVLAVKNRIAEKLVFSKIRENLGGRLEMCPCGGAYIADNLVLFFKAIGVPILVGYGLTETTATVTSFTEDVYKVGTVGKPLIDVEVKIGEQKEILVRAENVTPGYYNLPQETENHFTSDGWFKTGDAGHFDEDGFLVITDRIKELIKTANGKYIAPQLVEGNLNQSYFVAQSMVVGEGKTYAAALLTLDKEYVKHWAEKHNVKYNSFEELVHDKTLLSAVKKSITKEQANISAHERAKKFRLLAEEFTMEKNQLSPTLKLKRKVILKQFEKEINEIYGNANA